MKIQKMVALLVLALTGFATGAASQQSRVEASTSADVRVESRGAEGSERTPRDGSSSRAAAFSESHLVLSHEALEGEGRRSVTTAEIEAGARALAAGAERDDLEHVRDRAPRDRSLVASLDALATLSARGASSSQAAALVSMHLARGASDEAIAQLGSAGRAESALGGSRSSASFGTGATATLGGSLGGSLGSALGARAGLVGSVGGRIRL